QYVTQRPAGSNASAVAVAPVKNFVLVKNNRLPLAVRLNVGNERIKLLALHQGEEICKRMEFEFHAGRMEFEFHARSRASASFARVKFTMSDSVPSVRFRRYMPGKRTAGAIPTVDAVSGPDAFPLMASRRPCRALPPARVPGPATAARSEPWADRPSWRPHKRHPWRGRNTS